ncbi:MAG: VanZ family protein [Spirochaetaceae bacterium]|nr:VanZ family protein [Spirochaetaceae bacterium]
MPDSPNLPAAPLLALRRSGAAGLFATVVVLAALLMPGDDLPEVGLPGLDKLAHVVLFGCWALALRFDRDLFRTRPWLLAAAAGGFGLCGEVLQLLVPSRSFDLLDLAADLAGGLLAAAWGAAPVRTAERLLGRLLRVRDDEGA